MMSVTQGGIKYHFLVFGMIRLWIEPQSPGPLVNSLTNKENIDDREYRRKLR